jgi:hypothetical protein
MSGMNTMPPAGRNTAYAEFYFSASSMESVTWSICAKAVAMKKLMHTIVTDTWKTSMPNGKRSRNPYTCNQWLQWYARLFVALHSVI